MRDESAIPCHPERSEGSHAMGKEILRFAQDDKGSALHPSRVLANP